MANKPSTARASPANTSAPRARAWPRNRGLVTGLPSGERAVRLAYAALYLPGVDRAGKAGRPLGKRLRIAYFVPCQQYMGGGGKWPPPAPATAFPFVYMEGPFMALGKFTTPASPPVAPPVPPAGMKAAAAAPQRTGSPMGGAAPTQEQIAQRAYEKWLKRGRQVGTETMDWLEAEAELKREMAIGRNY